MGFKMHNTSQASCTFYRGSPKDLVVCQCLSMAGHSCSSHHFMQSGTLTGACWPIRPRHKKEIRNDQGVHKSPKESDVIRDHSLLSLCSPACCLWARQRQSSLRGRAMQHV